MKLYLSSYKFGDDPAAFSSLFVENRKVALITNALDFSTDLERRAASEEKQVNGLRELGLEPELIDLRDYFGKPDQLRDKLENFGGIWAIGGNTFVLRSAMQQSGLDEILREYSSQESKKEFVYGGYSAGICVLSPDLKGIDLVDEPDKVKEIYGTEIVWEGVGLINYSIAPHYDSDHPESEIMEKAINYFEQNNIPHVKLRDGEVVNMFNLK